jgi:hypothetical protein
MCTVLLPPVVNPIAVKCTISVLLAEAQAGEDSKQVNDSSNIGGPLDRLQRLSGRPKYR